MNDHLSIPVLIQTDALVVEATLAGCVAAHALARSGCRTVLTSAACSLPRELVVCRRPWVSEPELQQLPRPFEEAFRASIGHSLPAGRHLLNLAQLAIRVEDLLLDAPGLAHAGTRLPTRLARLAQSKESIGPLRRAFNEAGSRAVKVKIARLLCLLGDAATVPFLLEVVEAQIARKRLPGPFRRTLAVPPEHGWAGDPVYSLYAAGLTDRGAEAAPLLARIAEMIPDEADVFASKTESPFEYVRLVCTVAERNPGPAMLPALERLLQKRCLRGLDVRFDADLRLTVDSVLERRAYLELCLGRALARCGDQRGMDILVRYTHDVRGCLARSAVNELARQHSRHGVAESTGV